KLGVRAARWTSFFATQPRDAWVRQLREAGVACEPVLAPGELLADPHLAETGLAVRRQAGGKTEVLLGSPVVVRPLRRTPIRPMAPNGVSSPPSSRLLAGLKVADFSAFVAGPLAAQVL